MKQEKKKIEKRLAKLKNELVMGLPGTDRRGIQEEIDKLEFDLGNLEADIARKEKRMHR